MSRAGFEQPGPSNEPTSNRDSKPQEVIQPETAPDEVESALLRAEKLSIEIDRFSGLSSELTALLTLFSREIESAGDQLARLRAAGRAAPPPAQARDSPPPANRIASRATAGSKPRPGRFGKAKACILLFLYGSPPIMKWKPPVSNDTGYTDVEPFAKKKNSNVRQATATAARRVPVYRGKAAR